MCLKLLYLLQFLNKQHFQFPLNFNLTAKILKFRRFLRPKGNSPCYRKATNFAQNRSISYSSQDDIFNSTKKQVDHQNSENSRFFRGSKGVVPTTQRIQNLPKIPKKQLPNSRWWKKFFRGHKRGVFPTKRPHNLPEIALFVMVFEINIIFHFCQISRSSQNSEN